MTGRVQRVAVLLGISLMLTPAITRAQPVDPPAALARMETLFAGDDPTETWAFAHRLLRPREERGEPDTPEIIRIRTLAGIALYQDGLPFRALDEIEKAIESADALLGPGDLLAIEARRAAAEVYDGIQRYGEAAEAYSAALDGLASRADIRPDQQVPLQAALGRVYLRQGQLAEAEPLLTLALEYQENLAPQDPLALAEALGALGRVYLAQAQYGQARPLFERALAIPAPDGMSPDAARRDAMTDLAATLAATGDAAEAERLYRSSLDASEDDQRISLAARGLGLLYLGQGRYDEAEPLLRGYAEGWADLLGESCVFAIEGLMDLARLEALRGDFTKAVPLYRRAYIGSQTVFGAGHPATVATGWSLARTLISLDEGGRAEAILLARTQLAELRERRRLSGAVQSRLTGGFYRNRFC